MDRKLICLDSSVLIDYFRKKNKRKTFFFELSQQYRFAVSVMTKLEIFCGATDDQQAFWKQVFADFQILPLEEFEIDEATSIIKRLRRRNQMIELPDILIGATAKLHHLELATLNPKHFKRIEHLDLVTRGTTP
jgi:predicted nucleic acid-binding protein